MTSDNASRNADGWAERLERCQAADMTVAQFCQAEGVSLAAYYYWRRKLHGPSKPSSQIAQALSEAKPQPAFLPVALAAHSDAPIADSCAAMTLEMPGGIRVRLEVPIEHPGDHP